MMNGTPSENVGRVGQIVPQSASAAVNSGWLAAGQYQRFRCLILTGATAGNMDAKVEVAKSSTGTGAVDLTGKAITQVLAAGAASKEWLIDLQQDDFTGGYTHFRLTVTPGAATLLAAVIDGFAPRYAPVSQPAQVLQVLR